MFLLKVCAQRTYGRGGASRRLGAAASLSVFEQALEECQHFSRQNRLKKHPDEGRYPNPVDPFWMRVAILIYFIPCQLESKEGSHKQPAHGKPATCSQKQGKGSQKQSQSSIAPDTSHFTTSLGSWWAVLRTFWGAGWPETIYWVRVATLLDLVPFGLGSLP